MTLTSKILFVWEGKGEGGKNFAVYQYVYRLNFNILNSINCMYIIQSAGSLILNQFTAQNAENEMEARIRTRTASFITTHKVQAAFLHATADIHFDCVDLFCLPVS